MSRCNFDSNVLGAGTASQPPAPTVAEAHSVEYKREYARAGREFAGSDESMFSCGYAYGVIVGKRAAQLELDRLKAEMAARYSIPEIRAWRQASNGSITLDDPDHGIAAWAANQRKERK